MSRKIKEPDACLLQQDPEFPWTCGAASTYNNAGCRGEDCRAAITEYRRDYRRSKAQAAKPKKDLKPTKSGRTA